MISTYLILGKNDCVAGVAARGVGAPEVEDMLKEEYVFAFVNGVNNFDLGVYLWIATGQKCENIVEKYYLLVSVFMAL